MILIAAVVLGGSACKEAVPAGQVVAIVDGREITVAELNEEARSRGLALESDPDLRRALVKELVERQLLVARAKLDGIDRTPAFILAEQRSRDLLLAQLLLAEAAEPAGREALEAFAAAHPLQFDRRVIASVSLVTVTGPVASALVQSAAAEPLGTAQARLRKAGLTVSAGTETWDSGDPATPIATGEVAPAKGTRFRLERGSRWIIGEVTNIRSQPVAPEQRLAVADGLLKRQAAERRMAELLTAPARTAAVRYQPGYGPAVDEAGPSPEPAPAAR